MRFARWVVFTLAIHVLIVLIDKGAGLILYLLLAHAPSEKGAADLLTILPFIMMSVANLGLGTSTVYYLRRREFSVKEVGETTSLVALVWGSFVALAAIVASQLVLPQLQPNWDFDLSYVVPVCLCVPFLLMASYLNSIQMALDEVRNYNLVHLTASAVFVPLFFGFYLGVGADVTDSIAMSRLASAVVVTVVTMWMLRRVLRWRPRMHWGFFKAGVTYGWKANIVSVLTYLNHRVDLYLLGFLYLMGQAYSGDELKGLQLQEVAFYSLAVTFAELVWHFPEATKDLFFSKVAGSTQAEARVLTPTLSRLCFTASAIGALGVYLAVDPAMTVIDKVFGLGAWDDTWREPVLSCLAVLAPGTVAYTVAKVLQNDLAARGHLNHCLVPCTMVLVTMVGLDVWLVPEKGAIGAAAASSIAYGVSAVYSLFAYRICGGAGVIECLVLRRADWFYARQVVSAIGEKLRRRRS